MALIRILFVCTGNTCRSPMAEAILKNKHLPNVEVKSAGIFAMNGLNASENALKVLEENEIFHQHCSTQLTKEEVEWATYILTMTAGHKNSIIAHFPEAKVKTYTLKEFVDESGDVLDPFGGTLEDYRNTFKEIQRSVDKLINKIDQEERE